MLEYEKQPCVVSLEEAALSRTGMARLPLHCARAPSWLTVRMERFAKEIVTIIFDRYGAERLPERISSPFWFQTFGCVLGYDWHSSGVTTLVTRARLKSLELQFAVEKEKPPGKLRMRLKESAED